MRLTAAIAVIAGLVASVAAASPAQQQQQLHDLDFTPAVRRSHTIYKHEAIHASRRGALETAKAAAQAKFPGVQLEVTNHYTTKHNGVTHTYFRQVINGLPVLNALGNVNVDKKGALINMGETFFDGMVTMSMPEPRISAIEAINAFARSINLEVDATLRVIHADRELNGKTTVTGGNISLDEIPVTLAYVQTESGDLELVFSLVIRREDNWFSVAVGAEHGRVLALSDWVRGASYRVYDVPVNDPLEGARTLQTDPHRRGIASPLGWHNQNGETFTTTIGNNVYAQENVEGRSTWEDNYRPDGGASLTFDYPVDFTKEPEAYMDAAITNLFYWNNIVHDIFYELGFDEVSGNFQEDNLGNGGLGGDAVQANAQDGSGYNNANFATPPDGQRPRMRMYLWNWVSPMLDGDFDNGIIVHEYGHGISNRLTGGPANSNCLGGGQAGGMGEGWSDAFGVFLTWKTTDNSNTVTEMGEYAAGEGIRKFPYARNFTINPQTYESINEASYRTSVHAKGGVWCTVLYDIFLTMNEIYGFDADWYTGDGGNRFFLQDVVDGLKLQPCNPSFIDARDAIILANQQNRGGRDVCTYWAGFARRGLGLSATSSRTAVTDGFDVPAECSK